MCLYSITYPPNFWLVDFFGICQVSAAKYFVRKQGRSTIKSIPILLLVANIWWNREWDHSPTNVSFYDLRLFSWAASKYPPCNRSCGPPGSYHTQSCPLLYYQGTSRTMGLTRSKLDCWCYGELPACRTLSCIVLSPMKMFWSPTKTICRLPHGGVSIWWVFFMPAASSVELR